MHALKILLSGVAVFVGTSLGQASSTIVTPWSQVTATPTATASGSNASLDACQIISSRSVSSLNAFPTKKPRVPPSEMLACLQSVPLHVNQSLSFVEYVAQFLPFQTTLAYLANPPAGYLVPGVDMLAGIAKIGQNLQNNVYGSQWEFELDMHVLINVLPKDGHLGWGLPLMQLVSTHTGLSLLSVSVDGVSLPEVYIAQDLLSADGSWTPSPLAEVDGQPVFDFLQSYTMGLSWIQDPDALYNVLFGSIPGFAVGSGTNLFNENGNSYGLVLYGDTTNVTFANHSTLFVENFATMVENLFEGITEPDDIFSKYDLPAPSTSVIPNVTTTTTNAATTILDAEIAAATSELPSAPTSTIAAPISAPTVLGYPYPVVKHYGDIVAGYFLNETGFEDTAVLAITSFEVSNKNYTDSEQNVLEFQAVIQTFLDECADNNRTKLIVDLSANGGGVVFNGYDAFKQLFPTTVPFGGSRFRETPILDYLGNVSTTGAQLSSETDLQLPFEAEQNLDVNLNAFSSWDEVEGPFTAYNDQFTELVRFNLSDPKITAPLVITGYGTRSNFTKQPFEAKNIILLHDGYCASTCTIFSNMMKRQAGVRNIAIGGRPMQIPMQGQGGTKGSSILGFSFYQNALKAIKEALPSLTGLGVPTPPFPSSFPLTQPPLGIPLGDGSPSFNARNAYPSDNPDGLPLQFVYEAANCRMFYTFNDTQNIASMWARAANIAWGNGKCVSGSSVNSDNSLPSDSLSTLGWTSKTVSNATLIDGSLGKVTPVSAQLVNSTTSTSDTSSPSSTTSAVSSSQSPSVAGSTSVNIGLLFGMVIAGIAAL